MSLSFTNTTGNLFNQLGKIGGALQSLNAFRGTGNLSASGYNSIGTGIDNINAQYASWPDIIAQLYANRDSYRTIHATYAQYLQTLAQQTTITRVNADTPLAQQTLVAALKVLIAQMKAASASVTRPTVSASVTAGTNTGTGTPQASITDVSGVQMDYIFNENVSAVCTLDAQSGSATAGQEQFTITGAAAESSTTMWDWPLGSGASITLNATDALVDYSTGGGSGPNVLQNGSFKTFSNANAPDNWPIATGTAGTTVLQATGGNVYKGSSGMAFAGNGSELTSIQMPFATTPSTILGQGGSAYVVQPSTVYALNLYVKMSATPVAGVLEVALVDGSGNIVNDAAGTQNKITLSLPSISTSWVNLSTFFRTPAVNPTTTPAYKLRIRLSTALDNAKTVYFGHVALVPCGRIYAGGPQIALFSGATNFILGDSFTVAVANNYGSKWAQVLDQFFGLKQLGLLIPSSGSPTLPDSMVS